MQDVSPGNRHCLELPSALQGGTTQPALPGRETQAARSSQIGTRLRPRWPRPFYGWWVVGASTLTALYVGGVVVYGFTTLFQPIVDEFGWSYTQVSFAASLRGLEIGLFAPLVGMLVDRSGPRRLVFLGGVLVAAGLFLLSLTQTLFQFYAAFVVLAIGASFCMVTVLMAAVGNWFRRKVGIASGIVLSGFGLSGVVVPVMVSLIESVGWRSTLQVLSVGALAILIPMSLLLRHKPEQYGLLPDGAPANNIQPQRQDKDEAAAEAREPRFTPRQVLKTRTFWLIALAYTYHSLVVATASTHVMPYLDSVGFSRTDAAAVATGLPLLSVVGRIGMGWLGDRVSPKNVCALTHGMVGAGTLCLALVSNIGPWMVLPFLLLFSIGFGGNNSLRPALTRQYFGRSSFGTVLGLIVGLNMIGTIAGPPFAGWAFDTYSNYQFAWYSLAALSIVAVAFLLAVRPVRVST